MEALTWQPIDTAPRDGTPILGVLLYRESGPDDRFVLTIQWHEPWGQWVMSGCLIGLQNNANNDDCADPTHWMPLPRLPAAN